MDPNETLAELRAWAAETLNKAPMESPEYVAAQVFQDLDGWMTMGGYPPVQWRSQ